MTGEKPRYLIVNGYDANGSCGIVPSSFPRPIKFPFRSKIDDFGNASPVDDETTNVAYESLAVITAATAINTVEINCNLHMSK